MAPSEAEHRHLGYWINRALNTARCYECGLQFSTSEPNQAEDWKADSGTHG